MSGSISFINMPFWVWLVFNSFSLFILCISSSRCWVTQLKLPSWCLVSLWNWLKKSFVKWRLDGSFASRTYERRPTYGFLWSSTYIYKALNQPYSLYPSLTLTTSRSGVVWWRYCWYGPLSSVFLQVLAVCLRIFTFPSNMISLLLNYRIW